MTTTPQKSDLPEEIYRQAKSLNKEHASQVLDFITYLKLKETKNLRKNSLMEFIMTEADPVITLDMVHEQLRGIKGNLSDTIIEGREERV